MSILIKGIEMPKNCHECELVDILPSCPCSRMADEDFWNDVSLAVEGHKDCPIVPVPPHGRLIDADALKEAYCCNCFCDENPMECDEPCMDLKIILEAPTVIPADKEDRMYEQQSDMRDYCERYEPTYNPEDGSM